MFYLIDIFYKNGVKYNIFEGSGLYFFEYLTDSGNYKTSQTFDNYENLINSI